MNVCLQLCLMCLWLQIVRTNTFTLSLISSSLLQTAANAGQRWRHGSGPALLRLHPGVHLSAGFLPLRGLWAPCLPLWWQLDWQGASVQRYVVDGQLQGQITDSWNSISLFINKEWEFVAYLMNISFSLICYALHAPFLYTVLFLPAQVMYFSAQC